MKEFDHKIKIRYVFVFFWNIYFREEILFKKEK